METLAQALAKKRFGLVMSAGFFGFYGHAGFLRALGASGLTPFAYAGTSAGGLVGAYAAAGLSVYVLVSRLTAVSPRAMQRGAEVVEEARVLTAEALRRPPRTFEEQGG